MINDGPQRTLPLSEAALIDSLRDEFERATDVGATVRIEDLLERVSESARPAAFRELLKAEITRRRRRQEAVDAQEYIPRFPQFESAIREACDRPMPAPGSTGKRRSGLQVRCPYCHIPIELAPDAELESIRCGSCGSQFSLTSDDDQATRDARTLVHIGHFKLVERLGMGAFGTVWKAQDMELDRTVAIKIPRSGQLDKQQQDFFFREARSAAQLRHPNIVPVYEVGREGETLYIVSEFVRGVTLADRLTAGPLAARESAELCAKIAGALHHAHEQGVIHRDLKPANVMLDGHNEPHLMDFGLARREANEVTMTFEGQVLGTPAYMSPEQAQGDAHVADRRSDVYSLGVILFELLTGELPFRGNARMMIHQVIHNEPPSPRTLNGNIPRDMETIALKCMHKDPHRRYPDAQEAARELNRFLAGEPIAARPVSALERRLRWCQRNRLAASLGATAIALLAGVAVVATVGYTQTARALAEKQEAAATSDQIAKLLENMFQTSNPLVANDEFGVSFAFLDRHDSNLSPREVIDQSAARIAKELSDQPRVQARLLVSLGNTYQGLGMFEKAADLFQQVLAIEQAQTPPDPVAMAKSMHRLAMATYYTGDLEKCEALLKEALEAMKGLGDQGVMPATALKQTLAMLYMSKNNFDEAERMLHEVIATREKLRGPNDVSVMHGLQALVGLQLITGQLENTEGTILQILQTASFIRDGNWKEAAEVFGNYQRGLRYRDAGDHQQAAEYLKQTMEEASKLLGDTHPFATLITYDYGIALARTGQLDQAIELMEEAVRMGNSVVDRAHPIQLFGRRNLTSAYIMARKYEDAERMLVELTPDMMKAWGPQSWEYGDVLADSAVVQFKLKRPDRGSELTHAALAIAEGLGGDHQQKRGMYSLLLWQLLAEELIAAGKFEAAERAIAYGQTVAAKERGFSSWIERYEALRTKLVDSLTRDGQSDEAVRVLRASHDSLERRFGPSNAATRAAQEALTRAEQTAKTAPAAASGQ